MSYYYNEESKVNLMRALRADGWKIYGYKPDESDSMTDYFSPAYWEGIAEKNGFTLVVDQFSMGYSGYQVKQYVGTGANNNATIYSRIEKLKNMTVERGASVQEEESAKASIEKLQAKLQASNEREYKVVETYPTFSTGNPNNYKWHIEKDGVIFAMGSSVYGFYHMPRHWDYTKRDVSSGSWWGGKSYKEVYQENEEEQATVKKLYDLVDKMNKAVTNPNSCMVKKVTYKTKEVTKPVQVERKNILVGDILKVPFHGGLWKVINVWTDTKGNVCYTYELIGKKYQALKNAKRYYNTEKEMNKYIEEGRLIIHTIQTVKEKEEVIKWTKEKYSYVAEVNEETLISTSDPVQPEAAEVKETVKTDNVEIKYNEEKNGIELYFDSIPSEEVRTELKTNGFRWSKFNKCWYVKDTKEAREFLNKLFSQAQPEETQEPQTEEVQEVEQVKEEIKQDEVLKTVEINENLLNETCKSVFVETLEEDTEIFVHGDFADINKNNTLEDYKHMAKEYGSKVIECKITHVAVLTSSQWNIITNSFMYDCPLFAGLGGSGSHYEPTKEYKAFYNMPEWERQNWINQAYNLCVLVINADTQESILVDPQGHNYSRYVAFPETSEKLNTLVNGYIKLYHNYKEIEQLEKSINDDIDRVVEVAREIVKEETQEQPQATEQEEGKENVQDKNKTGYKITYKLNEAKKGIELTITGTLPQEIKDNLRKFGFSWFGGLKKYIAKQNPERIEFIQGIGIPA